MAIEKNLDIYHHEKGFSSSSTASRCFDKRSKQETVSYYIAMIWNSIVDTTDGVRLRDKERMLWKMGYDVSGSAAVIPRLKVVWDSNKETVEYWKATGNDVWFPSTTKGYRKLWKIIGCGLVSTKQLDDMFDEDPKRLKQLCEDISQLYVRSIKIALREDPKAMPALPYKPFKSFTSGLWLRKVVKRLNMNVLLACYVKGVPVEDIVDELPQC